jgi:Zn-dependent protease/CBS domain-containing protein
MRGIKVGRLFGVDFRIDWSWALIFLLLTWNLYAVFSTWHRAWSPLGTLAVAVIASLLFFACIVLHELAHAAVSQAYGTPVRSITLFLFGGVSDIEREPRSATAEFFTAAVGPFTSILLGLLFIFLTPLVTPLSGATTAEDGAEVLASLSPAATLLAWLGPVNILIGLFNLIPAFPLDGGRMLRAVLWGLTGKLRPATTWAARIGQLIGWLLIAAGIGMTFGAYIPFFGTGFVGGIWLAFIGWFLYIAATHATTRLALDDALAGLTVGQLMQRETPTVPSDLAVSTLVHDYLIRGADRALPVTDDGHLLGLVCVSDVRRVPPDDWQATPVSAVMRPADGLSVASPGDRVADAFEKLARRDIDQMPVVDNGFLVGMLRRRDVTRWLELAWHPVSPPGRPAAPSQPRAGEPRLPTFPHGGEPHPGSV